MTQVSNEWLSTHDFVTDVAPCRNPLCERKTTALYCCGACATAHEGKYEIHESGPLAHSATCDQRHAKRGGIPK